jgi:hypothetical protein
VSLHHAEPSTVSTVFTQRHRARPRLTNQMVDSRLIALDSKQKIEEFIHECFSERTEALKLRLEIHTAYWLRFYHPGCLWDSRHGEIQKSQGEKIVSISPTDTETYVITSGESTCRSRYHLKPLGESWSIHEIDTECALCRTKKATSNCMICDGSRWLNWSQQANLLRLNRAEYHRGLHSRLSSQSESYSRIHWDPAIEQFMTGHFQERSNALEKEIEIQGQFVVRYFSPEFDSTRWLPMIHDCDSEAILAMAPAKNGTHVYTTGFIGLALRYNLRPARQNWLIWQVDHECPHCLKQGRRADCSFCRGTIWEHRKTPPAATVAGCQTRTLHPTISLGSS